MHQIDLILTLTGGLTAALLFGYVTQRLGLSPIVGYLLAGIVVGPNTPGFVADSSLADQLAEIGVVLLMFGVGIHFHVEDLLAVRGIALPGALGQSLVATLFGGLLGRAFGWSWPASIVFGLAISVASTVVLVRVLADNNDLHTPAGHIAVGWLVVEDIFTILVLVLLPAVLRAEAADLRGLGLVLARSILEIGVVLTFIYFVGRRLIPSMLSRVADTRSRELFTLGILVVALGLAVGAASLFGVSMALGAFLAGMVVGQSDFGVRAASEALPMRDAFAVLFFVSVGMLLDLGGLLAAPWLFLATLGIVLVLKPLAALGIVLALGRPLRVALAAAIALAQIGEFSFILGGLARQLGLLGADAMNVLVASAILSISLNPVLYRLVDVLDARARRLGWARPGPPAGTVAGALQDHGLAGTKAERDTAVVVGCGPVGRTLVRLLRENDIEPTVIELNLDTVRQLRSGGVRAIYGDATRGETLAEAGTDRAVALILSSSEMHGSDETIRLAREINPRIRVFSRAAHLRQVPALRQAGADIVFAGEGEVALAMTEFLLRQLGATAEQIDRERARIRTELFGGPLTTEPLLGNAHAQPDASGSRRD